MFFIGGLNSILPYILYLSLIWVFLIVGFSGKIVHIWQLISPQPRYAINDELQIADSKVIHYSDITPVNQIQSIHKIKTGIPEVNFPPELDKGSVQYCSPVPSCEIHYYSSFGFRGPPSFIFV
jgi:hypothetical protein